MSIASIGLGLGLGLGLLDFANPKAPLSDIFLYLGHVRAHDKG